MSSYAEILIQRFKSKGVLVDANLLLLLLVGSYNPRLIGDGGFKRVAKYTLEDFLSLTNLLQFFAARVTTPPAPCTCDISLATRSR